VILTFTKIKRKDKLSKKMDENLKSRMLSYRKTIIPLSLAKEKTLKGC
jgi:hypothetical protein